MDSLALVEVSHWGALETDGRDGTKVRSGYTYPWLSLYSHLGPVVSLSKVKLVSRQPSLLWHSHHGSQEGLLTLLRPGLDAYIIPGCTNPCGFLSTLNKHFIKLSWNDPNLSMPSISCREPDGYTVLHYWNYLPFNISLHRFFSTWAVCLWFEVPPWHHKDFGPRNFKGKWSDGACIGERKKQENLNLSLRNHTQKKSST